MEEIKPKPEEEQPAAGGNGKAEATPKPPEQPTELKIAEIWIRHGQLQLDGSDEFWSDPLRAIGVIERCKDIVKNYKPPKPKIIQPKGNMMNFVRSKFKGRK